MNKANIKLTMSCPFHEEITPSFTINGNTWHCFGCSKTEKVEKIKIIFTEPTYPDTLNEIIIKNEEQRN